MSAWGLLDEKEEQELHKRRLLNVEEKPFKRITKHLNQINAFIKTTSQPHEPTLPDADADGTPPAPDPGRDTAAQLRELDQLREDLTLDFAAFDTSIARLQFLFDANQRERAGYEEKRQAILDECQAVRDRNVELRVGLEEARATMAQRKKFDELAEKITNNKLLRPREDQVAALQKLEEECRELERESETYSVTWRERRDQFNRIMEEGMLLRRQIRDEKEEVDRREGMNEDGEEDGEASRDGQTPLPPQSGNATPHVDSGMVPRSREGTPAADGLKPKRELPGASSGSQAPSRSATPQPQVARDDIEEGEDVEMRDEEKLAGGETPRITIDAPAAANGNSDKMEVDGE
ncbi:hypothetical protein jhhlp_001279 [Lomentospora prolificans]|uniref:Tho complex subunit 7/Mft1p n=1 Tax=Lomentospora prolificans TaxID=41688 RepID=A0A2N3NHS8_9PEZI|nr:hypothetical protein jhhlp_001279 [Lomentospora prolificans]